MEDGNTVAELQRDIRSRGTELSAEQALRIDARIDDLMRPQAQALVATQEGLERLFFWCDPDVITHLVAILSQGKDSDRVLLAVDRMDKYLTERAIDMLRADRGLGRLMERRS